MMICSLMGASDVDVELTRSVSETSGPANATSPTE
jgi:hypothetical protein